MAASLLLLLDDIATVLDDVAVLSKVAAKKTAGVLGDDLALNAQQVAGVNADRELPVVWAVAKGSVVNKAILVPLALLLSAVASWAILPLLMAGGVFLCFEGVEKILHALQHPKGHARASAGTTQESAPVADPVADPVAHERDKVRGAIRTDFILSTEIIVITLGTVQSASLLTQASVLAGVALLMTVGVYGLVALIVKLDDVGLWLLRRPLDSLWAHLRPLGHGLLALAPWLMRALSVVGTAAMFLVGGGIVVHGWHALAQALEAATHGLPGLLQSVAMLVLNMGVGLVAGALALLAWTLVQRLRPQPAA
ncbi:MAG: DUF808 domain-containing protein [Rhodoferax sp.]